MLSFSEKWSLPELFWCLPYSLVSSISSVGKKNIYTICIYVQFFFSTFKSFWIVVIETMCYSTLQIHNCSKKIFNFVGLIFQENFKWNKPSFCGFFDYTRDFFPSLKMLLTCSLHLFISQVKQSIEYCFYI